MPPRSGKYAQQQDPAASLERLVKEVAKLLALAAFVLWMICPIGMAQAQTQAQEAKNIGIRLGSHGNYTRMVFDFPRLTGYQVENAKDGDTQKLTVLFTTPLPAGPLPKPTALLKDIKAKRNGDDTLTVTLDIPADATFKHYRLLRRIVLDVFPAGAQVADTTVVKKPEPVKTAEQKPAEKTAAKPAETPSQKPIPKPVAIVKAIVPEPVKAAPVAAAPVVAATSEEEKQLPPALAAAAKDNASLLTDMIAAPVESVAQEEIANQIPTTITVSTVQPVKMAVFERFGILWLVAEGAAASAALPEVSGPDAIALGTAKTLKFEGGIAYRYTLPANREASVNRKSMSWEITIGRALHETLATANLSVNVDDASGKTRLLADIKETGAVLKVEDPAVGDTLLIVPVANPSQRIDVTRRFPDLDVIAADAGMVVRPLNPDIRLTRLGDYVTVTAPDGLLATPYATSAPVMMDSTTSFNASEVTRLFDFPSWLQGGVHRLNENRRGLEEQISEARSPETRSEYLMKLALLYFANNFGQETLGVLRILADEDPEAQKNPNVIALRGAAAAMAGRFDDAIKDLTHPAIQQHPEVQLWLGYAAASSEQWRRANQSFPRSTDLLSEYPTNIAVPMTIYMAESALRLGNTDTARQLLDTLKTIPNDNKEHHRAAIDYLRGEAARQDGDIAGAIELWAPVAKGIDRLYHTKAELALTQLQLAQKQIELDTAIDRIDSLRFAWRGDGLEVQTMTTLGRFKIMDQRYLDGLNDLKTAANLADAMRDDLTPLRVEMADTVASLFGDNEADRKKLPALEAVSIYNEFEDLLPEGEEGAPALLNFADYLIGMDLLDRAAGLINRALSQVTAPAQQADIGARLAAVYLLDSRPTLALEALERTNPAQPADIDSDLLIERTLLKARAQSQVNMTDAAIATLSGLASSDAQKLKADVLWRARRWGQAAAAIENLLPGAGGAATLDDETARLVMNAAVGYKLAGNTAKLADLRARFGTRMAATTLGSTFTVVTRDGGSAALADRETIMGIAGEVDMFKGFLDSYKAAAPATTATSDPAPAPATDSPGDNNNGG